VIAGSIVRLLIVLQRLVSFAFLISAFFVLNAFVAAHAENHTDPALQWSEFRLDRGFDNYWGVLVSKTDALCPFFLPIYTILWYIYYVLY